MQTEAKTLFDLDQQLDRMKIAVKTTLYPQRAHIMGHTIACDFVRESFEGGKRMVWEVDGIRIARLRLAQFIVANAK
jgi:hypothetical protein